MRHQSWISSAAYYLGVIMLVTLPLRADWLAWVPFILGLQLVGALTISVGYHRLFCHGAFQAARIWHWLFALSGVMFLYSSPLQWAVMHSAHHRHADTDRDPHPRGLSALLSKGYRHVPLDLWRSRRLLRSGVLHRVVDTYYIGLWFVLAGALFLASPGFFINAYLPALGLAHLIGGLHNALSHMGGRPRNFWLLEFILPAGGEWLHAGHHNQQRGQSMRTAWYHLDPGLLLILAIRRGKNA